MISCARAGKITLHKKDIMKPTSFVLAGCMLLSSVISQAIAAADTLPGSTEGAEIMKFTPSQDQTDLFSNVIYSQVKDGVAIRHSGCRCWSRAIMT
jgi:hypothetical protein